MIPPEIRDLPAFRGGVIAQLLLGEGGVAEGLEEAFVEKWEYANGWAATQRVAELWSGIADLATPEQQSDVDEMIVAFNAIYPSPIPPASFAGIDPEDAETPAQRMAGLLESVLDTALYSGRDQLRLISHLADLTATACDAYDAGDLRIGQGVIYAVYSHYGDTTGLGALIGLFAPEVNDRAMAAFRSLVTVEDATPGTTPAVQQPVMAEEPVFPFARWLAGDSAEYWLLPEDRQPVRMPGPEACAMLQDALVEGRTVLGG
jgi:hypothetical protein